MNFYLLLPLVLSAFSLILIAFVLKGHTQSRVHRLFSLYLFLLMLWGVFIFSMRASLTLEQAYFWEKTLMAVVPFVPVVFYHFAVSFTGINIRRWLLPSAYTIAVLFALISRTKLIMSGMETRPFGYAPVEGPAMIPLFLFCSAVMIMALHILWKSSRRSPSADERNRSTYIIFAVCIFFLGNIFDILPVLGLPLYPGAIFGNILFCLITTVAIVKYQLLDIRIVFRTGTAYFLMSAALAIPYVAIIVLLYQLLEQALPLWAYIVLLVLVALALQPLWWRVQRVVDRWFYRERYDVLRTLEDFSKETHKISDPNQLCSLLVKLIYRAVQSSNVHILLHSGPGDFRVISSTGENTSQRGLDSRSPLLRWLQSNKSTLLRQDLNIAPQLQSLTAKEMNELKQTKAELFVPIMTKEEELIGILILGQKLSQQPYSGEDERLILTVANRMAIELENSRLYQHIMESEEKLRLMYEFMAEGVTVSDLDGNIVQMNETMVRMHGSDNKEALIGRSLFEFTAAKDHPRAMENLKRTIRDGYTRNIEYTLLRRDGSEFPAELSASVLKDTSGNPTGFVIIIEDLTERKKAEAERKELERKAQVTSRLATVGEMASGIAHEINNPLTSVIGLAELLMQKDLPEDIKNDLEIIHTGAKRVASIISRLLTFARQQKPERTYANINEIIETTIELRAYELKTGNIKIATHLDSNLPQTMADTGQLQQVFLNIILNAEKEMKTAHGKGDLVVKTERADDTIRISFKDDGPGIAKENLEKVFNPFFTTREAGGGTGLGLSICHGIVTEHKGRLYVKSQLGKGATFIIELPIVAEAKQLVAEAKQLELVESTEEAKTVSEGRILVVDDESAVLQFLDQLLTGEGYEVETAETASNALKRIKSKEYGVILLDIKLPDMNGIEFYRRIQKIAPSLANRVVFVTGDVMGARTTNFLSKTKVPYITKPINIEQLMEKINSILS